MKSTHLRSTPKILPISDCFTPGLASAYSHIRRRSSSVSIFRGPDRPLVSFNFVLSGGGAGRDGPLRGTTLFIGGAL